MKKKAPTKPKRVDDIVVDLEPILMPLHGGVVALGIPREAWPTPSPQELASIVGACGWQEKADGPQRAMRLAWQCAQVIHESHSSTDAFIKDKARRKSRKAKQLEEVTGRDITALPDEITHSTLVSCFNTERLKINGKELRGRAVLDAWIESKGTAPATWHAHRSPTAKVADHSPNGIRWELLAVQVARFNEWRKATANANKGLTKKNLRKGTANSSEESELEKYQSETYIVKKSGRKNVSKNT
jgi:hypothetical protein